MNKSAQNLEFHRTPPRLHQKEAVQAIVNEFTFKAQARTKYIAPCGSGKTLVALHVAERLNPISVIVFLPSLALIRQTLIEWSKENMFGGDYTPLFVCSDKTLMEGIDENIITEKDLGHPITTEVTTVKRFLQTPTPGTKVVFSTYQSAKVVSSGIPEKFWFDFGLLDEAHRTAGRAGKPFGLVLDDNKIPIRKRLSMTATPRHYKIRKAILSGEIVAYSMDSIEQYGTTASILSFRNAVDQNLVCDNKILFSAITTADIDDDLLEKRIVVNRISLDADRIANLIAVQNAIKKHNIKKIFTFHGRVADAKEFIEAQNPPLKEYLPGFKCFHINGNMPTERREQIMEEFKKAEKAIISNAKCLSEGVDIPSAECIVFMCPKKSTIEIVQAVGRASRRHPGKRYGFVLLPIFVNQIKKENIEEAIERTGYSYIWQVLNALKEQDETLDLIIKNATIEFGMGKEGYTPEFPDKIEILGSKDTLAAMKRAIATMVIQTAGESFDFWLGLLKAYAAEKGHCRVPGGYIFRNKYRLGQWASMRRHEYRVGTLSKPRLEVLISLNFEFEPLIVEFEEKINLLAQYFKRHGHCNVLRKDQDNKSLSHFVHGLRSKADRRHSLYKPDQLYRLDAMGFDWYPHGTTHERHFAELAQFKLKAGHCRVTITNSKCPGLCGWVHKMRRKGNNNELTPEEYKRLDALGFDFKPLQTFLNTNMSLLKKFIQENGHSCVPLTQEENGIKNGAWVNRLRADYKMNDLPQPLIDQLNAIGFDWFPKNTQFEKWFSLLLFYKKKYGHCRVPGDFKIDGKKLGYWVTTLRIARRTGEKIKLTKQIIKRLDAIGFVWEPQSDDFEWKFQLLVQYKSEFGHVHVKYEENFRGENLGRIVKSFRRARKEGYDGILTQERMARLEKLGLDWSPPRRYQKRSSHYEKILRYLKPGPRSNKEIQSHLNISTGAVKYLTKSLIKRGLVKGEYIPPKKTRLRYRLA